MCAAIVTNSKGTWGGHGQNADVIGELLELIAFPVEQSTGTRTKVSTGTEQRRIQVPVQNGRWVPYWAEGEYQYGIEGKFSSEFENH